MHGLMMDSQLLIPSMIDYAATYHGDTEIVTRTVQGPIHRYTYGAAHRRIQHLACALESLGVVSGDRIATFAWNTYRHFEIYYATSGMGAICHTVNPRLFKEQIEYIVNHARDRYIFADTSFVPLLEQMYERFNRVEGFVILCEESEMPDTSLPKAQSYEALLAASEGEYRWPELDERTASALCYTSGTTGNPKGVLYSHRSTVLHSLSLCAADSALPLSSYATVLPVVPMFHVNAWGVPYAAPMAGAKLVLPGPKLDGASLFELMEQEAVDMTAGVPTVWMGLLDYLEQTGEKLPDLDIVVIGGSAAPLSMIEAFQDKHGVTVHHAWGMTEMSPVGTTGRLKPKTSRLPAAERHRHQAMQGRAIYGVEVKIVDDAGQLVARDGKAVGELAVRGPFIACGYYEDSEATRAALDGEGWFRTGDVATLDEDGYLNITDRSKDLIKSGGEWISSIDLENTAVGHPDVAEAAVIGIAHEKWSERPLLVVVRREGSDVSKNSVLTFLTERVASWWVPDDVVFVDELPHTATGKIQKVALREQFRDYQLPL